MSITFKYRSGVTTEERPTTAPAVASNSQPLVHTGFTTGVDLTASTTPPVTTPAIFEKSLTAGAATLDLTALTHLGASVTMSGLKVQAFKVKNKTGNSVMTFSEGASNGYALLGASFTFKLLAGQEALFYLNDASPDVAAGDRTIDIAGTGTETCEVTIIAG
jgi:hypothetical protein